MIGAAGDGWDSDQTVKIGKAATNNCFFSNHYAAEEDRPAVKAFVEAYRARYKNQDGSPKTPDAMAIAIEDPLEPDRGGGEPQPRERREPDPRDRATPRLRPEDQPADTGERCRVLRAQELDHELKIVDLVDLST